MAPRLCVFRCCCWKMEPPGVCSVFPAPHGGRASPLTPPPRLPPPEGVPAPPPCTMSSRERLREEDVEPDVLGGASRRRDNLQRRATTRFVRE